jgi:hypothetical protein
MAFQTPAPLRQACGGSCTPPLLFDFPEVVERLRVRVATPGSAEIGLSLFLPAEMRTISFRASFIHSVPRPFAKSQ